MKYEFVSRTDFEIGGNTAGFRWVSGDTIGIFPDNGYQVAFEILPTEESNEASFTGGGWGLKTTNTYASYYPFIGKMYLDKCKIPVTYVGQKQTSNSKESSPSNTSHLGKYDYMVAPLSSPNDNGGVSFEFKHLGSLVILNLTIPTPTTLESVTLTNDVVQWTTEGYYDLMAPSPSIIDTEKSKTMTVELEDITTTQNNEVVSVYFWTAPVDLQYDNITAKVVTANGNIYSRFKGKNLKSGEAYMLNAVDFIDEEAYNSTLYSSTIAEEPSKDRNGVYLIKSASNMKWFMENASKNDYRDSYYKLMIDINFSGTAWTPKTFSATLDGNGHSINNLLIRNTAAGLFTTLYGTVKNLILMNPSIDQSGDDDYYNVGAGALAAQVWAGATIINCGVVGGEISGGGTSRATSHIGGLIGGIQVATDDVVTIKGCFVNGTTIEVSNWGSGTGTRYEQAGGLIGSWGYSSYGAGNIHITSCYTKDIVNSRNATNFGSFIGVVNATDECSINTCYYDASYEPFYSFADGYGLFTKNDFEAFTATNFSEAMTDMNTKLTDCEYVFSAEGTFIKRQ